MSEKIEEEKAIHNALLGLFCWVDTRNDGPAESKIFKNVREVIDHCIRSAVAAQKEKDASVDPLSVACPTCSQRKKEFCQSVDDPFAKERPHDARWRAAIRKETS